MADVPAKMALPAPRNAHISVLLARLAALVVCVIGGLALLAYSLSLTQLTEIMPGLASLSPNAASGLLAAGIGLFCFTFRGLRFIARLIGILLVIGGLAVLLGQDLFGFNLDQTLWRGDAISPGVSPAESVSTTPGLTGALILFGLTLLYAKRGKALTAFSQIVALVMIAQVLLALASYAYGVATYYYPFPFTSMSFYGATCAFLLALGLLAASPEDGIAAAIIEPSPAGEMLRRLLPGILVLPLVIGWFARQAETSTYYDSAGTLAIFAVASILVLAVFAWTTIGAVRHADRARNAALMELRGQREWLSTTLGSIGDGVIATDPNGSVLLLNKIAEELTAWPGVDARGRPIWEVFRVIDEGTRKPVDDPA
ncbi:MAG: PAS domain-containing protein, partial [Methyloceanibacter sp.]